MFKYRRSIRDHTVKIVQIRHFPVAPRLFPSFLAPFASSSRCGVDRPRQPTDTCRTKRSQDRNESPALRARSERNRPGSIAKDPSVALDTQSRASRVARTRAVAGELRVCSRWACASSADAHRVRWQDDRRCIALRLRTATLGHRTPVNEIDNNFRRCRRHLISHSIGQAQIPELPSLPTHLS